MTSAPVIHIGNCLDVLREMSDDSIDSIVTDPPYGLSNTDPAHVVEALTRWATGERDYVPTGRGFMGKEWDAFVPPPAVWDECLRVLKPGGHLLAFAGSRTFDLMTLSIRFAGFDIRDSIAWLYGSGFPKSLDVSKAIDKVRSEDLEPAANVARFLVAAMDEKGVTRADVNRHFGHSTAGSGAAQQWTTTRTDRAIKPRVPTWEQWETLREWLGFGDEMDTEVWRLNGNKGKPGEGWTSREIVGQYEQPDPRLQGWAEMQGNERGTAKEIRGGATTPAAQQWQGWGTALKPAFEPIVVARKPLAGTVAANVLAHGTGALNIDGCRVGTDSTQRTQRGTTNAWEGGAFSGDRVNGSASGRWPVNVLLDGDAADALDEQSGTTRSGGTPPRRGPDRDRTAYGAFAGQGEVEQVHGANEGGASRFFPVFPTHTMVDPIDTDLFWFSEWLDSEGLIVSDLDSEDDRSHEQLVRDFLAADELGEAGRAIPRSERASEADLPTFRYQAKAPTRERPVHIADDGTKTAHPTVKPLALMRWLVRLVTPPGGVVLDPFVGSGTTVEAAALEGFQYIGIEGEADYLPLIQIRLDRVTDEPTAQ